MLLLRVGQLGHGLLAEQGVQVALVPGVGHADQDGEEEEGDDGLPDLDLVGADEDQDDDQPDVGQHGRGRGDAEHDKVFNPDNDNKDSISMIVLIRNAQIENSFCFFMKKTPASGNDCYHIVFIEAKLIH